MNARLRTAIADAKAVSLPKDNIERAIKKGSGGLGGEVYEELVYEGYGPGGIAVLCEITTDNRNRTAPEIRKLFEVHEGKLGATGCVAYMFDRKGLFLIPVDKTTEDRLMEIALESGADDIRRAGEFFEVTCAPENFVSLDEALDAAGIEVDTKQLTRIPQNYVAVEDLETARKIVNFIEALDDHDDVQNVSSNYDIPDEALAEIQS